MNQKIVKIDGKLRSNYIFRILSYLKPYWKTIIIAIVLLVVSVAADLAIPSLIRRIIDLGITPKDLDVIRMTTLLMILIAVLEAIASIGNTFLSVRVAQSFAARVRAEAFHKIQKFSFGNLDRFLTGQIIVRLTSDINMVQMMVMIALRMFIRAPIMVTGSIALMFIINAQLTEIILLILPLTLVLSVLFIVRAQPMFLEVQRRLDRLNSVLQENLAGVRVVKAFVRTDHESKRFEKANVALTNQNTKVLTMFSFLFPSMQIIINLSILSVLWFGGLQVAEGSFSIGEILAFANYLLTAIMPLLFLAMMASQLSAANASAQRIYEIIDVEPEVKDKPDAKTLHDIKGQVVFDNVCFNYNGNSGELVLQNINLIAEPGQTIAILGATGSGKSSLIDLIPRFYDVVEGSVKVDGIDVRDVTVRSLRSNIGIALQEAILFSGTIRENIRFGKPEASDQEVEAAAKAAQAHEFIMSFPKGYDSDVGERGAGLSGGQKQRISIARALLVQPKILILDDSTSSVDVENEAKIQEQLDKLMENRTSFIIAQRISTVLKADKIIVLDKGQIAAEGTHEELMKSSSIYKEIYDSQLGGGFRS
ncbi:MAG: ATP-binding cassette, subfamily multidrug efflux pump [Thermoproteota archaeon]|nr:ATP-binding cassette, subfamily multidrug efflux pump [Thermoproteota archaeon]